LKPEKLSDKEFKYTTPLPVEYKIFLKKIDYIINEFVIEHKFKKEDIIINRGILIDLHKRIDQRKDYYQYFHSDENKSTYMSEAKENALLCYWTIKYKPFSLNNEIAEKIYIKKSTTINEMFALFCIRKFVIGYYKTKNVDWTKFFTDENQYILIYNFMQRDLSKEAFILLVTSLIFALEI
jgi:hypothetical protein